VTGQLPHHCGKCDNRWHGYNTAHCGACHQTFTAVTAFDKHRTGSHSRGTRRCLPPAEAGLVLSSRSYPCWTTGTMPQSVHRRDLSDKREVA
jgi:hypothetical protein